MSDEVMDKKELAQMLRISERTIERWISECRIPYVRLPKRGAWSEIRFLKSNILAWLKRNEVKPSKYFRSNKDDDEDD